MIRMVISVVLVGLVSMVPVALYNTEGEERCDRATLDEQIPPSSALLGQVRSRSGQGSEARSGEVREAVAAEEAGAVSRLDGLALGEIQEDRQIADDLIERIVEKYNKNDFEGIYALSAEDFRKKIGEAVFVRFLRRSRNGGDILRSSLTSREGPVATYRLEMQARDMLLNLTVEPPNLFRSFGLRNAPIDLLTKAPDVETDNPRQSILDRAIDVAARKYFLHPHAVGLSIGVIDHGVKSVYHYGKTLKERGVIPNSKTLYEIGSITKTFTGTLLAQAVCDGKVNLGDDIRKYLAMKSPGLEFQGKPITLRDLANHTSRLPTLPDDVGSQPGVNPVTPESNYDAASFYAALSKIQLDGPPGEKIEYSNWGMALLGHLLEHIYGKSYAELLSNEITGPLAMPSTTYKSGHREREQAAVGHFENGKVALDQDAGMFGPAGDIVSNLDDMLRYLEAQLHEKTPAIALTHQATTNGMGLGWGVRTHDGHREIQHNGSTNGFTSHISGFLDSKKGCVVLSNSKVGLGEFIGAIQTELKKK